MHNCSDVGIRDMRRGECGRIRVAIEPGVANGSLPAAKAVAGDRCLNSRGVEGGGRIVELTLVNLPALGLVSSFQWPAITVTSTRLITYIAAALCLKIAGAEPVCERRICGATITAPSPATIRC